MTIFWRFYLRVYVSLLGLGLLVPVAAASTTQALDSIVATTVAASKARALQHGYNNVSIEVRPLDPRLRLPQCSDPLTSSISQNSQVLGSMSVAVGCNSDKPWTIYVRARVTAQQAIPVLARPLARNTLITEADLMMINQPMESTSNGMIVDSQRIIGMELTRALDAGSVIRVGNLRQPKVIKRGQSVTLVSGLNGLQVSVAGKALGDAVQGGRIAVTNLSSGKRIEGIAQADGTVNVP